MLMRTLVVMALGIAGSIGLVQPASGEEQAGDDDLANIEPAGGERDEDGGFFDFLRNLEVNPPRVPRTDTGGDGGGGSGGGGAGGGGGDSGGSGGHN